MFHKPKNGTGFIGFNADRYGWPIRALYVLVLAVAFIVITGWLDGASDLQPATLLQHPWPMLLNALPGLGLAWLLLIISRRTIFSLWIPLALYTLLGHVNAIKVSNLRTPLLPQDAEFLTNLNLSVIHLFGEYAGSLLWITLIACAFIIVTIVLYWLEAPVVRQRWHARLMLLGAFVVVLVGVHASFGWHRLYSPPRVTFHPWDPLETSQNAGVVNTLMTFGFADHAAQYVPAVKAMAVTHLLDRYQKVLQPTVAARVPIDRRPNIVIVQSESFFDPTVLNGFAHDAWLPHFHEWQAKGTGGWMHVPTFGGGTIRTEFEVLTGISLAALPHVNYPYLQLPSMKLAGLPSVLNHDGYETISIHPNGAGFWNRGQTFRQLGFQKRIWRDDFSVPVHLNGRYVSDKSFVSEIIHELKAPSSGKPKFIFAISIESHGPYKYEPHINYAQRDAIVVPPGLSPKDALNLKNYLYHMHNADTELDRLANWIMASKRPTILVFYGDHLPPLPATYKALGFRNGGKMLSEPVPWLMLDNRHRPEVAATSIAAWMLPSLLLRVADVHEDGFFRLANMLPRRLGKLTHSPWIEASQPDPEDTVFVDGLRNTDILRTKHDFSQTFQSYLQNHADVQHAAVVAVASAVGSYVTPSYEISGIANAFTSKEPLFARVDLAGSASSVTITGSIYLTGTTAPLRTATARVEVDGARVVNLDLSQGTPLPPGQYQLQVAVGQTVDQHVNFAISKKG